MAAGISVEKAREQLEAGEDRQPAASAQRLATVSGIATDKFLTLTGRPSQVTAATTVEEDLRFLRSRVIPDAEVVEEPEEQGDAA